MSNSQNNNISVVRLRCLHCDKHYVGQMKSNVITCKALRNHIANKKDCYRYYTHSNLIRSGKNIRNVDFDLHSSIIDNNHDDASISSTPSDRGKRKEPASSQSKQPPSKKIHLSDLTPEYAQHAFGTLPIGNMLSKRQSFGSKEMFVSRSNWKAPPTEELDALLFHGGSFFSHFTTKAVILDAKGHKHLILGHQATEEEEQSQSSGEHSSSSEEEEEEVGERNDDDDDDEEQEEEPMDGPDVDDGSEREVQEPPPPPAVNPPILPEANIAPPPAEVLNLNFRLIERLEKERQDCQINPYLDPDPRVLSQLNLLALQKKHNLPICAVADIQKWAHDSYNSYPRIFDCNAPTLKSY